MKIRTDCKWTFILILLLFFFNIIGLLPSQEKNDFQFKTRPALQLFEKLVLIPNQFSVLQVSSHNKKGQNGDENWPLYRDKMGDDVIFDSAGPGCIKSMWGTNFDPEAIIKFYFDGENIPRISVNLIDFYKGKHPYFPSPLVSYEKRGMWGDSPYAGNCFVPIPFEKSLKISVKGESRFFHIIYEKYPYPTDIAIFTGSEDRTMLMDAFKNPEDSPFKPYNLETFSTETEVIEPGQTVSLLKLENTKGVIREIFIEADGAEDFFRDTYLKMRWDGHQRWDVHSPTGIFFGTAVKADNMRSLPLQVEKLDSGKVYMRCFFPMPFWEKAEIEWTNRNDRKMAPLVSKIFVEKNPFPIEQGTYFTTLYRAGTTTYHQDWILFEGLGSGWYAGTVQSMQNAHYCEGDEHFVLDGAVSPQFNGTGSEDYYLACFWPNVDFDTPFGCVAGSISKQGGGHYWGSYKIPSSYSRFHLEAPIPFYSSISARIQHGGLSHILSNYRSLSFCYYKQQPILSQTDFIDVGNTESEEMHEYTAPENSKIVQVTSSPEGEYFETIFSEKGRIHSGGEIRFKVAVDAENNGVRIRRLLDQKIPRQKSDVYVDGQYCGCWYFGYQNEYLRWYDSDFEIHPQFTQGKNRLSIRLLIKREDGEGMFTDFNYKIFSYSNLNY